MSYAKGTPHYNFPLTMGDDKRDWFDTNEPFAAVDAALNGAVEEVAVLDKDVTTLKSDMETAKTDIVGLKAYDTQNDVKVSALQTLTAQHTVDIENVRQDSEDMICAIEEGSATASYTHEIGSYFRYNDTLYITTVPINVGDTIVPDVNCSTTDIVTQLGNNSAITRLQTQVGDKDISSYGASVTDAIVNSNVKVLDGELYKRVNNTWSKYFETQEIDVSLGSNDYFTAETIKCRKYGNVVELYLYLKVAQNLDHSVHYQIPLEGLPSNNDITLPLTTRYAGFSSDSIVVVEGILHPASKFVQIEYSVDAIKNWSLQLHFSYIV